MFFLFSSLSPVLSATWYVDRSLEEPGDGKSWETAFGTIQRAIDAASDGDTITVSQGTYYENIHFGGKNIVLRSTDPLDPGVVENTIIDGNQAGSVMEFDGTEDETCVLSGFTIRNGSALAGGGICGGTRENCSRARIQNNIIVGNSAEWGGGVAWHDGTIRNNTIAQNSAEQSGGGLYSCYGPIESDRIKGNSATGKFGKGGGLYLCSHTIQNNRIIGNSAGERGGGLHSCGGMIRNNIITGNSAGLLGGSLYGCDGTIENDTIYGNVAELDGIEVFGSGAVRNCIIWGNRWKSQLSSSTVATYCCIERWSGGGEGNITRCPYFVNAHSGDFHLKSWSPCIDAGDPTSAFPSEPEPNGGRINMGAYGNTGDATSGSPDSDLDELPDEWEIEFFGNLAEGAEDDADGDMISNIQEYYWGMSPIIPAPLWHVDGSVVNSGDGGSWDTAFKKIQEGIDAARDGDIVIVAKGTYVENIKFNDKDIVLRSTDPLDPEIVANTIIDGNQAGPVVAFDGTESGACVLAGFTIRNGSTSGAGGGIIGGSSAQRTLARIQGNIITDNSARKPGGGGLAYCDGVTRNNTITWNRSERCGGGLAYCQGAIQSNVIAWNSADEDGGGLYECDALIQNNTVADNWAEQDGGGLCRCDGTISNCIIWANTASRGAQLYGQSRPAYCCVLGWSEAGVGNIFYNPRFADDEYHLSADSPCIDAGKNEEWMRDAVDLDGNPRIFYGVSSRTVDMGAYEYGSFPFRCMAVFKPSEGGTELRWNSRPGDSYTAWSCLDLETGLWNPEGTIESQGGSTTWTDSDTAYPRKFYRIEIE